MIAIGLLHLDIDTIVGWLRGVVFYLITILYTRGSAVGVQGRLSAEILLLAKLCESRIIMSVRPDTSTYEKNNVTLTPITHSKRELRSLKKSPDLNQLIRSRLDYPSMVAKSSECERGLGS